MEKWKDIPDYHNYQISNLGNVRNLKHGKVKLLKKRININGYFRVILSKNGNIKAFQIHQLVAMSFLNHKPDRHKLVIDHINSDKLDNRMENLKIVTNRENCSKERTIKSGLPVGVTFYKKTNKYMSTIKINGKKKYLGSFNTIEEASQAYQLALHTSN
jgi:hypothetical protein